MKHLRLFLYFLLVFILVEAKGQTKPGNDVVKNDDPRSGGWLSDLKIVGIKSSLDGAIQKAYYFKSKSSVKKPLIVSLHTWSGSYAQRDTVSVLSIQKDINYIHPDFRGANTNPLACGSVATIRDIDDAISFAINQGNVDEQHIYVVGVSGGGYATLNMLAHSKHAIRKISAWAAIANLEVWYYESLVLKNRYAKDILDCTNSKGELNLSEALKRSPITTDFSTRTQAKHTDINIYAGVYDGIQGSVSFTHSINFYNKLLMDLNVKDQKAYVSDKEKLYLLEFRKPLKDYGNITDRKICLKKKYKNISLVIFEGNHEILNEYAFENLLTN